MAATIDPAANSLEEASIILDGHNPLDPSEEKTFNQFYVSRPQRGQSHLIREAKRAIRGNRPFHWFFTGHTGSGKSTELNRIMVNPDLTKDYLPIYIDLEREFDIHNIDYTDIIFAFAKGCARKADSIGCKISPKLKERIENWGAEIISEEEITQKTEGKAGLNISLKFLELGEEIRSGGEKRRKIRRDISENVSGFILLIDELIDALETFTDKKVLSVLDGLDHIDIDSCLDIFYGHYETITLPKLSKIIVIPLSLLNTRFIATIEKQFSTVPNMKVFKDSNSTEINVDGLNFYKDLISRYISLNFFDEAALRSLFKLSAGILRDMIRNTGDACAFALEGNAEKVTEAHVKIVWNEMKSYYRRQLFKEDYTILKRVDKERHIKGIDGMPPLLHNKAVVFYPNGEGWYGVHPAVQEILIDG